MTWKDRLLIVLQDGQWHSFRDLLEVYYKYTQRLYDLRRDGYVIEERPNAHNKHAMDYRLVKEPLQTKAKSEKDWDALAKIAAAMPIFKPQEKQIELFA